MSQRAAALERITAELARISREQHALERRKAILREAATRLRTGMYPGVVERMVREETGRAEGRRDVSA